MEISEQQFRELLDKYLSGKASNEEVRLLDNFFDSHATEELPAIENVEIKREILVSIEARIRRAQRKQHRVRRWLAVAASLTVIALTTYLITHRHSFPGTSLPAPEKNLFAQDSAKRGQKLMIELSDGSKVHLNSNSKIIYPKIFSNASRDVVLSGEAYFEVVHNPNKPFRVKANGVTTEVLGTSFNVKAFESSESEITLVEGKVVVSSKEGRTTMLAPNEQAVVSFRGDKITKKQVDASRFVSWKDNLLYFDQTTLGVAKAVLENWYDVDIELKNPSLEHCVVTGKYKDESLENVLKSLEFLLKVDYSISGNKIQIDGKGCQ